MNPTERDRRDYEELVHEYAHSLYRFSYRLTSQAEAAEDLVQETFEQAWRGIAKLLRADSPRAWLFRILRRRYGRWVKRQVKHRRLHIAAAEMQDDGDQMLATLAISPSDSEHVVDTRDEIHQALARLDDRYKQPLLLVVMEELSVAEAAQILAVRRGTILSRLHRGRQQMRRILESETSGASRPGQEPPVATKSSQPLVCRYKRA